ncbi:DUF5107 domain-containing protein [Paenibacillus sp. PAMC21692]|uniref:DUF5107 domain-containing protein n=1 Tax=Paenibacillus sp. PAMC21692 TaxID=2762320 RepID=UPI00164D4706|nr:DUF5107 domain-containing protein [Paenibacillus sp. PAMC21692]QNK59223.1 DUF5107 domain-containing protein [Paenibacillus sp. PAMC21692]
MLQIRAYTEELLTHPMVAAGPIPSAQDPDGVYPYESYAETSRRPVLKSYRFVTLENDRLKATICPDLGGKVYSLIHSASGKETLYAIPAVRPVRILPRQFFIGGGIEVSFPISHTPVQIVPVLYRTMETEDRIFVWCGERETRFGMHWTVEYSLGRNDDFLTQRTRFYNPTSEAHPWMSWSNAGVPARADTEFQFPNGPVLAHGDRMETLDWAKDGPKSQCDIDRMTGYFWREPDCQAFGVYTPSLGSGLYHVADRRSMPGIKLWSDGVGKHEAWVSQYSLDGEQCLEIQAGPIMDQSIKRELAPGGSHHHIEFWIPTDRRLDIYRLAVPEVELPEVDQIPLFGFARAEETEIWEQVAEAWRANRPELLPPPPGIDDNRWAISGYEEMEAALRFAVASRPDQECAWRMQLGAWYAGKDRIDEALAELTASGEDRAWALAARLYRRNKGDNAKAAECYRSIRSQAFALHPQVTYERDLALSGIGPQTLAEREYWLERTSALQDEWLAERRAAWLADSGRFAEAKRLLAGTAFQLVHQRYARTKLWRRIMEGLGEQEREAPAFLGEDDLFAFGAYREYGED